MNENYSPMNDDFSDNYGDEEIYDDNNFSNTNVSYPITNRYNNAYGNYRGGYDRSNQGPPLGFGPIGPMAPFGLPGSGPNGPPYPMQGDMGWRRGYSGSPGNMVRGAKKDKIIKYLLRCGIPRDQVLNLPNDILAMMHPMNCGVCAQQFESIDLSRIHYASKNHLKNQKKWVNQRFDSGTLHSKEPLKSRDLYCELCDVHITSTGHAESHYAGKPHRSIVEGRKNPRNPFLLQPNKQGRMKALIRREIKFLKKQDSLPADKKPKSENKGVSSELYCNICKTSMMCSEQMTTHLNGKRHLNKEKQHILRLMKGEVMDDGNKNTSIDDSRENAEEKGEEMEGKEQEDEEEEDEEDEEEKGGRAEDAVGGARQCAEAAATDDDWGEGGEDWKPSAEDY